MGKCYIAIVDFQVLGGWLFSHERLLHERNKKFIQFEQSKN